MDSFDSFTKLLIDFQELVLEIENTRDNVQFFSSDIDAVFKYLSAVTDLLAVSVSNTLKPCANMDLMLIFFNVFREKSFGVINDTM